MSQNTIYNATYRNMWEATKMVPIGKFTVLNIYIRKTKSSQINDLSSYLRNLGGKKKGKRKSKASRRKKLIRIRAEINKIKNMKTIEK